MAQYVLLQPLTKNRQARQPQVHLARNIDSNELVVIKWLNDKSSTVEQHWFKQELAVLQDLASGSNYPYALAVIEAGHDGLLLNQAQGKTTLIAQHYLAAQYLVMPYIEQGSLATALVRKNYDLKGIHYIIMQLIDAVEKLHYCGWLHLDLKPSNILLAEKNLVSRSTIHSLQIALIDFALAQRMAEPSKQGACSRITQGTPKYMSPEQFLGQPLNQQTDYYALGLILYELLAGQSPFCADLANSNHHYQQWAIQHCQQPVPLLPPSLSNFQTLIDGLLAKDRQNRIQTTAPIRDLANMAFSVNSAFINFNE